MNKTTLGMILLGAMVFTKAFLVGDPAEERSIVSRDNSLLLNVEDALLIRESTDQFHLEPIAKQFAHHFNSPEFVTIQLKDNNGASHVLNHSTWFSNDNDLSVEDSDLNVEEEIIPMDIQMNTGYGLWKSSEEKIISKEERNGLIPLDRGNTISDNISKLFPRVP